MPIGQEIEEIRANCGTIAIEELIGNSFGSVENRDGYELVFKGKESFNLYHEEDCCESKSYRSESVSLKKVKQGY